jgi:Tol biopolymer transport system component
VHDRRTDRTERVSVASDGTAGNYDSYSPSISANGRFVAFGSEADNLVPEDNPAEELPLYGSDVFVHDRQTGETSRVSVASDGTAANFASDLTVISADGALSSSDLMPRIWYPVTAMACLTFSSMIAKPAKPVW